MKSRCQSWMNQKIGKYITWLITFVNFVSTWLLICFWLKGDISWMLKDDATDCVTHCKKVATLFQTHSSPHSNPLRQIQLPLFYRWGAWSWDWFKGPAQGHPATNRETWDSSSQVSLKHEALKLSTTAAKPRQTIAQIINIRSIICTSRDYFLFMAIAAHRNIVPLLRRGSLGPGWWKQCLLL